MHSQNFGMKNEDMYKYLYYSDEVLRPENHSKHLLYKLGMYVPGSFFNLFSILRPCNLNL